MGNDRLMGKKLDDQFTIEFKQNLQAILDSRKVSTNPKKLSLDADLGETAVRDILTNRSGSPKLETVYKIARALNVGVYDLIPSLIGQTYEEIESLRAENKALHDVINNTFTAMNEGIEAARKRSEKSKKKK